MAEFTPEIWLLLILVVTGSVFGMLHVIAAQLGFERRVHDLRLRSVSLRREYASRLANMGNTVEAELVELVAEPVQVAGSIGPEATEAGPVSTTLQKAA